MLKPATCDRLSHRLAREQAESRLPSIAAGVVRNGQLAWAGARGTVDGRDGQRADADTQYRIGSITKTFVAVAIMRLRDEGLLDLDDNLDDHVPGTTFGHVTIAQLLSHSTGLQAETHGPWWERTPGGDWDDLAESEPVLRLRAGQRLHYSNVGYGVLGELVARKRGQSWANVVQTELLKPLGMSRTTTRPVAPCAQGLAVHPFANVLLPEPEHDAGALAPAGQLWSTTNDLAKWAALIGGDTGDVLSSDTLAEMWQPRAMVDVPDAPWTTAWGLGLQVWNTDGRRSTGHGGSMPGFQAILKVNIDSGDGLVAFTNSTTGPSATFSTAMLQELVDAEPPTPAEWRAVSLPDEVFELVGPWYWGAALQHIEAMDEGRLRITALGFGRSSRFKPAGDGSWVGLDGYYAGEPLRVVRHDDGTISHLDLASFIFTRTPYDDRADVPGGVDPEGWR